MRFTFLLLLIISVFHVQLSAQTSGCPINYINPTNGSKLNSFTTADLIWQNVAGATSYEINIKQPGGWFFSVLTTVPQGANGITTYTLTGLEASATYQWYIAAKNATGYVLNCYPAYASFSTADSPVPPACTFYSSPQNGSVLLTQTTAALTWYSVASTNFYDIYLWTGDVAPTQPFATVPVGPTNFTATGLTAGTTYHWYVVPRNAAGGSATCVYSQISFTTAYAVPLNDDCSGALEVVVSNNLSCVNTTAVVSTIGATASSIPACNGFAEDDIWFKFTPTSKRNRISLTVYEAISPVIELFTGSCASLQSMWCYTATATSNQTYQTLTKELPALIPGQTYYYRVYGSGANSARTNIYTCIATLPEAPSNDECSGALLLTANADTSSAYSYTGVTGYASQSIVSCIDPDIIASDVWFKFVATASSQKISVTPNPYAEYDFAFQVFNGTCDNLNPLACINNGDYYQTDSVVLNNLIAGNTYYMRVWDYHGDGQPQASFQIVIKNTQVPVVAPPTGGNGGTGLQAVYYNGTALSGTPLLTRVDTSINLELTYSKQPVVLSPAPGIVPEDLFSVRWTGQIQAQYSEQYTFYTLADDGIMLWVNGVQLINNWVNQGATEKSGSITLAAGQKYDIVIEYYENTGEAVAKLFWSGASTPKAIVPKSQLFPSGVVTAPVPSCVANLSPVNAATVADQTTAVLTWQAAISATLYDVYLSQGPGTPTIKAAADISSTTYTATGLSAATSYSWYVVPKNAGGSATGCANNTTTFTTATPMTPVSPVVGIGKGLQGEYFNNITLTIPSVLTRIDATVNNDFVYVSPAPGIVNLENYSVRWSGQVQPQYSETYTFYANTDDGVRLWVNGVLLIDNWVNQGATEKSGTIALVAGMRYDIKMEYYQGTGYAVSKLLWSSASTSKAIIPASQLYSPPAIISCPNNYLPANNSTIASQTTATFSWFYTLTTNPKFGPGFDLYLWSGSTIPSSPVASSILVPFPDESYIFQRQTVTFTATGLTPGTKYNWYILPRTSSNQPAWGCVDSIRNFTTAGITPVTTPGTGLQGIYYSGNALSGTPLLTRTDPTINFDLSWMSPAPGIVPLDNYSVRWTGQVKAQYSETYTFYTKSDDGIRLWVNGVKLVDDWMNQGETEYSGSINLLAGQKYDIVVEYYEAAGDAVTKLLWSSASTSKAIVPQSQLYPPVAGTRVMDVTTASFRTEVSAENQQSFSAVPDITASLAPNPVKPGGQARLQIISNKAGTVTMNKISSNGSFIAAKKINLVAGVNTTMINTNGLAAGFYVINIAGSSKPLNLKLLIE